MSSQTPSKQRQPFRYILVAVGLFLIVLAPFSAQNPIVQTAKSYTAEVSTASIALYASLRLINSVLSVAMETEVSGGAVLVSGTIQPLKLLEPVDDTVERVADAVFILALICSIISLALMPISGLGLALLGGALISLALLPERPSEMLRPLLARVRNVGLALGFAVPLGLMAGFAGGDYLTKKAVSNANQVIASITTTLEPNVSPDQTETLREHDQTMFQALQERLFADDNGFASSAAGVAQNTKRYLEIAGQVMGQADDLFMAFLELLAAYLFQLIILPLFIIWVLWRLMAAHV